MGDFQRHLERLKQDHGFLREYNKAYPDLMCVGCRLEKFKFISCAVKRVHCAFINLCFDIPVIKKYVQPFKLDCYHKVDQ